MYTKMNDYYQTPKSHAAKTPSNFKTPGNYRELLDSSDDSTTSSTSDLNNIHAGSKTDLSLVAEYDDLIRLVKLQRSATVENVFISYAEQVEDMRVQWQLAMQECHRLQLVLDGKSHELSDLESKLNHARRLVDHGKKLMRKAEEERDYMEEQVQKVREMLFKDTRFLPPDNRDKFDFLNNIETAFEREERGGAPLSHPQLSAIREVNTTGSLLSDFSYSRSEDDLDVSTMHAGKTWKKHRPSGGNPPSEQPNKKRRSSTNKVVEINNVDTVRATTTLTVPKNGPITATSVIESVPALVEVQNQHHETSLITDTVPPLQQLFQTWQQSPIVNRTQPPAATLPGAAPSSGGGGRQHTLQSKTAIMPDTCGICEKRIKFGKNVVKCRECRALCHPECRDRLPLPCVPSVAGGGGWGTPTSQKNGLGLISDYTPTISPMVPALIVHCLKEIELRGSTEIGLYRIPGSEREVKTLKERFMKGKGSPCLNQLDIHVLCGCVKNFLRSLHEPLVTHLLWPEFVKTVTENSENEREIPAGLQRIIDELPQPNRDTLAYMILHLKRIADIEECKMPISNLSKIFGPTIVGYSTSEPEQSSLRTETRQQVTVMQWLMTLPTDYWQSFIDIPISVGCKLQQTPSTDSLLRATTHRNFFTPSLTRSVTKRRPQRFFPTSPQIIKR